MSLNYIDWDALHTAAINQLGRPYKWGAKPGLKDGNPKEFDCSGFVRWVYGQAGVQIPEGSEEQLLLTKPVEYTLQIGDVGFFIDPVTHVSKHVGLILDAETVIEARGLEPSLEAQGIKTNCVLMRPRERWESWHEFSGWRRFGLLY